MPPHVTSLQPLHILLGSWLGQEHLASGVTATTLAVTRLDLHGLFLISDHLQQQPDGTVFHNHLLYGWDEAHTAFTFFQFDSTGRAPDGPTFGQHADDDIIFERHIHGGTLRYTYHILDEDHYHFRFARSSDGATWAHVVDGDFHRL